MFGRLNKKLFPCRHEFDYLNSLERTGYYDEAKGYDCPYFRKRIMCPCIHCHEIFFAHCGLDLPGKLIQTEDNFLARAIRGEA